MPFGLIQIEQERSDLWKAEVEAGSGLGSVRRLMVHAATFEGVMAKVAETYRGMVPLSAPKLTPAEEAEREFVAGVQWTPEQLERARTTFAISAAEPAGEQDAPEASEAAETETGDQAPSAGLLPSEAEGIARSEMGAVRQKRQYRKRQT